MPRACGDHSEAHSCKGILGKTEALRGLQATQSPLAGQGVQKHRDFRLGIQGGVLRGEDLVTILGVWIDMLKQ